MPDDHDAAQQLTPASLLFRLRSTPDDRSSWEEFVTRYLPLLKSWGRHWGLQEADAEDVAQAVLVRLTVKLRQFHYDPESSFRGWLRAVARHAWLDYVSDLRRQSLEPGDPHLVIEGWEAGEDLEQRLSELFDLELLEEASGRVRQRIGEKTWEAFRRTALLGEPTRDVAAALGVPVANVFKAKSNVRKMIQEELRQLEEGRAV